MVSRIRPDRTYGTYVELGEGESVKTGDRMRIALMPRFNGYVYLVSKDPGGDTSTLFPPTPDFQIEAERAYWLPDTQLPIQRCPTGAIVWIDPVAGAVKGPAAKKIIRKGQLRDAPS